MFKRRRRHPTPGFGIPNPFNPIQGEQANLRQDGTSPFCAMMQVASDDTYANHVICRGFDTRILRFIDYAAGNADKPGISVAKPFGKRVVGTYKIGEVYPALLPTQGNTEYSGFKQVTYVPPSPVAVKWRLGQNPGVVSGGLSGGQPANLSETIGILYDHNGNVVNWLLVDAGEGNKGIIEYKITSLRIASGAVALEKPYTGLWIATVVVKNGNLINTTVEVVDHSGCIFAAGFANYTGWAHWDFYGSLEAAVACDTTTPFHWAAFNRCCDPNTGTYATPC